MSRHKLIIRLNKTQLTLARVSDGASSSGPDILLETSWNKDNLSEIFGKIHDEFEVNQLNLVLAADLYMLFSESLAPDTQLNDQVIYHTAQEYLQTDISELGIDYQQIKATSKRIVVQILAVKKSFLSLIGHAAQANDLSIAAVEPEAMSLARLTSRFKNPHVILYEHNNRQHGIIVHRSHVYASVTLPVSADDKSLSSLLSYSKEAFGLTIKTIVTTQGLTAMANKTGTTTKTKELNPFSGAVGNEEFIFDDADQVKAQDIFGESDDVEPDLEPEKPSSLVPHPKEIELDDSPGDNQVESSIIDREQLAAPKPPLKLSDSEEDMESTPLAKNKPKSNAKLFILVITVLVVLGGLVGGGILVYQNALSSENTGPQVIVSDETPQPTPDATPQASDSATPADDASEIDASELSVQILNGSGVPGAAGNISDILEENDFSDIDTGNANSFDYEETEIRVKEGQTALFTYLEGLLSDEYTIAEGDALPETSDFDAVITVGQE